MAESRAKLTVLILAKNESRRIARCLERVTWADEIIVVDDMSTDQTAAICRRFGATVVQRPFDNFSNQANFGLGFAAGDWVLSLDADEWVTSDLREATESVLRQKTHYDGFTFKRLNFFLGHRMRYGGWYHDVLHLFRRTAGRFSGEVHHTPQLVGPVGKLSAEVEHYPFENLSQFIQRQNRYTSMEVRELKSLRGVLPWEEIDENLRWKPIKLFWKFYVKKQGFREGMYGFIFSVLFAWVHFLKWAKYWECTQNATEVQGDSQ